MKAYATVIYLRMKVYVNIFQTNLLLSEMHLVPIKQGKRKQLKNFMIPRLQLLAILIVVWAANFMMK